MTTEEVKLDNLNATLPPRKVVYRRSKAMALLDAILCPEWEYRYYSFDAHWADDEELASMRDGCGNEYFVVFYRGKGIIFKGYEKYSPLARHVAEYGQPYAGLLEGVPHDVFSDFLDEPAFSMDATTFCIWNKVDDERWRHGEVDLDEMSLDAQRLSILDTLAAGSAAYHDWAQHYYERAVPVQAVEEVFALEPLSELTVKALNPDITLSGLREDIEQIDYPR